MPIRRARSIPRPVLCPGFYGIVIVLLSVWLGVRAIRQGALRPTPATTLRPSEARATAMLRLALAAGLGLFFVVGLIGRVPFWLASAIFVALFTVLFEWQPGQAVAAAGAGGSARPSLLGLATGVSRHAGVREGLLCAPALRVAKSDVR